MTARVVVNLLPGPEPSLAYTVVVRQGSGVWVKEVWVKVNDCTAVHVVDWKYCQNVVGVMCKTSVRRLSHVQLSGLKFA